MSANTLKMIKDNDVKWVDLRFTDTKGKEQHLTLPISEINTGFFEGGKMFDGSSIAGWKGINESDMILMPDDSTAVMDPFTDESTLNLRCSVIEPSTGKGYNRDPRSIAQRAEEYLKSTGIGDTAYFGPEPEFFIFDDVKWHQSTGSTGYYISSQEAAWSSNISYEEGNTGHRPGIKGGYFPVPPVDSLHDIRGAMCAAMQQMGLAIEVHHHEVATAGQCEIGVRFGTLVRKKGVLDLPAIFARLRKLRPGARRPPYKRFWKDKLPMYRDFRTLPAVFRVAGLCLLIGWLPGLAGCERFFQRLVHRDFAIFVRWVSFARIVPVRYEGFALQALVLIAESVTRQGELGCPR